MGTEHEIKAAAEAVATTAAEVSWVQTRVILRLLLIIIASLLAVAALLWTLYELTSVLLLLVLAIFFAYLVAPLVEFVRQPIRLGGRERVIPRPLAIGLVYLALLGAVIIAFYLLIPQLGAQLPGFAQQARGYWKALTGNTQTLNDFYQKYHIPPSVADAINSTVPRMAATAGSYAEVALASMVGWLAYIPWLILIPILAFFLLKDAESFRRSALQMLPRGRWRWRGDEFFQDVNSTLAAYIRAQLTACILVGVVCSIAFALFGLPNYLVLGLIAGLLEFIPLVGPLTMAVLAVIITSFHSGFGHAAMVGLFLGILRIAQDYVIYPRIIGQGIHLHPLAVILAILCGAELAGIAGVFLAIPVIAIITVSYRHWLEHRGGEGLADLLQPTQEAFVAEALSSTDAACSPPQKTAPCADRSDTTEDPEAYHPTARTTPDQMARARPDLVTGELKLKPPD
jgi:predicted PurR-regulated permease PerM